MIRPSDRGPGKARPPRSKASGGRSSAPPPPAAENGLLAKLGCSTIALPAVCVLAMFLIAAGVVR